MLIIIIITKKNIYILESRLKELWFKHFIYIWNWRRSNTDQTNNPFNSTCSWKVHIRNQNFSTSDWTQTSNKKLIWQTDRLLFCFAAPPCHPHGPHSFRSAGPHMKNIWKTATALLQELSFVSPNCSETFLLLVRYWLLIITRLILKIIIIKKWNHLFNFRISFICKVGVRQGCQTHFCFGPNQDQECS